MIGSMISLAGYWLVLGLLQIWAVIKVFRGSPLLAIVMFFFWPASILALFRFWGDEESDIRIPFFLSLVCLGMMVFMANRAMDKGLEEFAMAFNEDDIAIIREEDPELAMMLEAKRAELIERGELDPESGYVLEADDALAQTLREAGYEGRRVTPKQEPEPVGEPVEAPVERDPEEIAAERRHQLMLAAGGVSFRFGFVDLGAGVGRLQLPQTFRFATRDALARIASLHEVPLDDDVLGWAVHRRMDLGREDAWFVEVRRVPLQRTLPPRPMDERQVEAMPRLLDSLGVAEADAVRAGPMAPSWDSGRFVLRWSELANGGGNGAEFVALVPLRREGIRFSMRRVPAERYELAERATRLIASGMESARP